MRKKRLLLTISLTAVPVFAQVPDGAIRADWPTFGVDAHSCGEFTAHALVQANGRTASFGKQSDPSTRPIPLATPIPQLRVTNGEADTAGFVDYSADCKMLSQTVDGSVLSLNATATANGRCARHNDGVFSNRGGDGRTDPELSTFAVLPGSSGDKWSLSIQYSLAFRPARNGDTSPRNPTCTARVGGKSNTLLLDRMTGTGTGTWDVPGLTPGRYTIVVSCKGSGETGGCYSKADVVHPQFGVDGTPTTESVELTITSKRER